MNKVYEKTDPYIDLKGATIDFLNDSLKIGLNCKQSILRELEDMEGAFEDNEFERILTLIAIGIFAMQNGCFLFVENDVKYAMNQILSGDYDNLLDEKEKDVLIQDIKYINSYI